jgi:hypothetical protein
MGGVAAILLSAGVAFANEGQATSTRGDNGSDNNYRMMSASTTARMQTVRDEAQTRMMGQRGKAMQRFADIQDKVKQDMAQRIATQFDNLNSTWTDNFMKLLDRYDAILVKIQARADIASSTGKDITATTAAIQSAKTALLSARTAVVAQAAKTYTLNPSTIPTTATSTANGQEKIMKSLRMSFQNFHSTLFKDLFALRDGPMKDARKALQNAVQTLGSIPRVDEDNATSTDKKSNQ